MSGRLTDEQLRDWREDPSASREIVLVIDELLANRAALVKAVQETARVWDGIVAALDISDSDDDVVKTIQDMVEYAGVINAVNAQLTAERDSARAMLREAAVFVENAATAEQFRIDYKDHYGDHEGVAIALRARIATELEKA